MHYHLFFAIQDASTPANRANGTSSLKLLYHLLVRFSRTLDTAKRAIWALNSAVFLGDSAGSLITNHHDGHASPLNTNNGAGSYHLLNHNIPASMDVGDLASRGDALLHRNYDSLGDMSLFAFLNGAADEVFQYNINGHQQMVPNMGPGF